MNARAQSTTVGFVLIIALTVAGAGTIVALGGQALDDTRQASHIERVQHGMMQFDSRAAMVALGNAPAQRVNFAHGGDGSFSVQEGAGWLRVTHHNYSSDNDHVIYNESLGVVTYRNGDTVVAYQGGGVWQRTDNGSVMVSPPEFHYRDATLTLPVTRVVGEERVSGNAYARIAKTGPIELVYPNASAQYPNGDVFANPISNGTVTVTVHSEYYQAWAEYFRTRTEGTVREYDVNETAYVVLNASGKVGDFQLPSRSNGIHPRGLAQGHSVQEFTVTLDQGNSFNNMYFSFYAEKGDREFEMLLHVPDGLGGNPCNDGTIDEISTLEYDVYYYNGTAAGHHAWSNGSVDANEGPIRLQCDSGDVELHAEFTGDTPLTYGSFNTTNDLSYWYHDWEGPVASYADFNHTDDGEPTRFQPGETTTSRHLVRHYLALLGPNVDLVVNYGPGNSPRVDTDTSYGSLEYDTADNAGFITFLHITENEIRVDLE